MADKMYAGVKALIEKEGKYLFVGYELDGEMLWIPPGGRLEHGETPLEGLKREIKGEVSLDIEPGDPVGMYHFFIGSENDGEQVTLTVFEVEGFEGEVDMDTEHAEEDDLDDYRWMTPGEIMTENTTETLKEMLEEKVFGNSELPKLVRDNIPEIIDEEGQKAVTKEISDEKAKEFLREKVVEEAREFSEEGDLNELADLKAVMDRYMELEDISERELEELEREKSEERGGFSENIVLKDIDG